MTQLKKIPENNDFEKIKKEKRQIPEEEKEEILVFEFNDQLSD